MRPLHAAAGLSGYGCISLLHGCRGGNRTKGNANRFVSLSLTTPVPRAIPALFPALQMHRCTSAELPPLTLPKFHTVPVREPPEQHILASKNSQSPKDGVLPCSFGRQISSPRSVLGPAPIPFYRIFQTRPHTMHNRRQCIDSSVPDKQHADNPPATSPQLHTQALPPALPIHAKPL